MAMRQRWLGRLGWIALPVSGVAAGLSICLDILSGHVGPVDWATYTNGADRFLAGLPLYSAAQLAGPYQLPHILASGYLYPPPTALLFVAHGPFVYGYIVWATLNVGLLVSGLAAVLRRELGTAVPWPLALVLFALAILPPFYYGVGVGNISIGLAGMYAWTWANRGRWLSAVSGFLAVLKLYPGVLVLWRVRETGSWRPVVVAVGVAVAICLATLPLVGVGAWRDFLVASLNARPTCKYSLPSVACLTDSLPLGRLFPWALAAGLLAGSLRIRSDLLAFGCLGAGMLAPLTDMTDYYLITPFVFLVVAVACTGRLGPLAWERPHPRRVQRELSLRAEASRALTGRRAAHS